MSNSYGCNGEMQNNFFILVGAVSKINNTPQLAPAECYHESPNLLVHLTSDATELIECLQKKGSFCKKAEELQTAATAFCPKMYHEISKGL